VPRGVGPTFRTSLAATAAVRELVSGNLGVSGSCLLMELLCPGTPEWTNLELFDGQVEPRSRPFSLDHSSHLEFRLWSGRGKDLLVRRETGMLFWAIGLDLGTVMSQASSQ